MRRERYIVFALLYYKIDYDFYFNKFGSHFYKDFTEELERLKNKGLIDIYDTHIQLTQKGLEWHTNIILEFLMTHFGATLNP